MFMPIFVNIRWSWFSISIFRVKKNRFFFGTQKSILKIKNSKKGLSGHCFASVYYMHAKGQVPTMISFQSGRGGRTLRVCPYITVSMLFWVPKKNWFFYPKNRDWKSTSMEVDKNWHEHSLTCQNWWLNIFFLILFLGTFFWDFHNAPYIRISSVRGVWRFF